MFIGYRLYATFYSQALYKNLRIKLEPWIIAAGLFLQVGNCKNYMGRETMEYSATRSLCTAWPSKSKRATLPPMLHSILQGNDAASGQCWELGCDTAGQRWSVSLPRASLFLEILWCVLFIFFFWSPEWLEIPRDCNMCRDTGFFSGSVYCVCCSVFVWTFTGIAD